MTTDEQRRWYIEGAGRTGLAADPLPFFDTRSSTAPARHFIQRARITGGWEAVPVKHYVEASEGGTLLVRDDRRATCTEPGWVVHEWPNPSQRAPRRS